MTELLFENSVCPSPIPLEIGRLVFCCHAFDRFALRRKLDNTVVFTSGEKTKAEESFAQAAVIARRMGLKLVK